MRTRGRPLCIRRRWSRRKGTLVDTHGLTVWGTCESDEEEKVGGRSVL